MLSTKKNLDVKPPIEKATEDFGKSPLDTSRDNERKKQGLQREIQGLEKKLASHDLKINEIKDIVRKNEERQRIESDISNSRRYQKLQNLDRQILEVLNQEKKTDEQLLAGDSGEECHQLELAKKLVIDLDRPEISASRSDHVSKMQSYLGQLEIAEKDIKQYEKGSELNHEFVKKRGSELNAIVEERIQLSTIEEGDRYGPLENTNDDKIRDAIDLVKGTSLDNLKSEECHEFLNRLSTALDYMEKFMKSSIREISTDETSDNAQKRAYEAKLLRDILAKRGKFVVVTLGELSGTASQLLRDIWNYHQAVVDREELKKKSLEPVPDENKASQLKNEIIAFITSHTGEKITDKDKEYRIKWEIYKAKRRCDKLIEEKNEKEIHIEKLNEKCNELDEKELPASDVIIEEIGVNATKLVEGAVMGVLGIHGFGKDRLSSSEIGNLMGKEGVQSEIKSIDAKIKAIEDIIVENDNIEKEAKNADDIRNKEEQLKEKRSEIEKIEKEVTALLAVDIHPLLHASLSSLNPQERLRDTDPAKKMIAMIELAQKISPDIDSQNLKKGIEQNMHTFTQNHTIIKRVEAGRRDANFSTEEGYGNLKQLSDRNINEAMKLADTPLEEGASKREMIFKWNSCAKAEQYVREILAKSQQDVSSYFNSFRSVGMKLLTRSQEIMSLLLLRESEEVSEFLQYVWEKYQTKHQSECKRLEAEINELKAKDNQPRVEIMQKLNEITNQNHPIDKLTDKKVKKALENASTSLKDRKRQLQDYLQSPEQSDEPEDKADTAGKLPREDIA